MTTNDRHLRGRRAEREDVLVFLATARGYLTSLSEAHRVALSVLEALEAGIRGQLHVRDDDFLTSTPAGVDGGVGGA